MSRVFSMYYDSSPFFSLPRYPFNFDSPSCSIPFTFTHLSHRDSASRMQKSKGKCVWIVDTRRYHSTTTATATFVQDFCSSRQITFERKRGKRNQRLRYIANKTRIHQKIETNETKNRKQKNIEVLYIITDLSHPCIERYVTVKSQINSESMEPHVSSLCSHVFLGWMRGCTRRRSHRLSS
jgi:hypothetical protein